MAQKRLIDRWADDDAGFTVLKPAPTPKKKVAKKKTTTKKNPKK